MRRLSTIASAAAVALPFALGSSTSCVDAADERVPGPTTDPWGGSSSSSEGLGGGGAGGPTAEGGAAQPSGGSGGVTANTGGAGGSVPTVPQGALGTSGDQLTLDAEPRFLLGISYFSCLYASHAHFKSDLDWLKAKGFQVLRCWVNWPIVYSTWDTDNPDNVVLVRADGTLDPDALGELEWILDQAAERQMVIDVTFNQDTPPKTFAAHENGIVAAATALAGRRNLLFDLQNETSHYHTDPANFMSPEQVREVRDAVKAVDPERVTTASVTSTNALASFVSTGELDLATYHCCRNNGGITDWAAATTQAVAHARNAIAPADLPIYFQEPNRCGSGGQYADCTTGDEFVAAAVNAKTAGAAAWIFHNEASYDLRTATLASRLNAGEHDAVNRLAAALAGAP